MFITLSVRYTEGPRSGKMKPITCRGEENLISRLEELAEMTGVELVSYDAVNPDGSDGRANLSLSTRSWMQKMMFPKYDDPGIIDLRPVPRRSGHITGKLDRVEPPIRRRQPIYSCCEVQKCSYCGCCHNASCSRRKVVCELAQRDLMHREFVPLDEPGYEQVEAIIYHDPEPQKRPWWKKWWR